jgi:hypothetical protein
MCMQVVFLEFLFVCIVNIKLIIDLSFIFKIYDMNLIEFYAWKLCSPPQHKFWIKNYRSVWCKN